MIPDQRFSATHHLNTSIFVFALLVEALVVLAAIQKGLVATQRLAHSRQTLDDALAQPFALSARVDGDVFNVARLSIASDKLVLDEEGANSSDLVRLLGDDDDRVVVRWLDVAHQVESGLPGGGANVGRLCEDSEDLEMAAIVVVGGKRAYLGNADDGCLLIGQMSDNTTPVGRGTYMEVFWQSLPDSVRDELGIEDELELIVCSERHGEDAVAVGFDLLRIEWYSTKTRSLFPINAASLAAVVLAQQQATMECWSPAKFLGSESIEIPFRRTIRSTNAHGYSILHPPASNDVSGIAFFPASAIQSYRSSWPEARR